MKTEKKRFLAGVLLLAAFSVWTLAVRTIDVRPIGPRQSAVGFAALNGRFHRLTNVHWALYTLTDWLGLVPIFVCLLFACIGLAQLVRRRSLFQVDLDIRLLGVYYALVIFAYLLFEAVPINCRPVLIEGVLEASYPSSTTLLVLSVMPTLCFQAERRLKSAALRRGIKLLTVLFSLFMVAGRLLSGVHWFTDIVGAILLSGELFYLYQASVLRFCKE
ncbi:phosphatase PAP2 family protein [Gemmiger sp.]